MPRSGCLALHGVNTNLKKNVASLNILVHGVINLLYYNSGRVKEISLTSFWLDNGKHRWSGNMQNNWSLSFKQIFGSVGKGELWDFGLHQSATSLAT